ncbi:prepilin-type N-terminal cleavage/methylation domain-containing protein [Patescibacteria group bacterium]|nr:prepilin-type N-terminal cleavage/methylation domain-containing protein [Patescibacteria group bacterium]MBU1029457.1 prepilin-type N-terminal cleavage/methylation domain-containing protein [Patescibacteria group bacterium]MBU1916051.1 prepilin-type N-terminal cleavage/methylation domain-containing protein [Patescibacteria group bacterium]
MKDVSRKANNNRRGFTLVEMLISLSIFAVVTAFAMANFKAGQQGDELRLSARITASLIQRARTQTVSGYAIYYCHGGALAGQLCPTGNDAECGDGVCQRDIPPAYGINISAAVEENREVRIFADINGNEKYDVGEALRSDSVSPGPFVFINSVAPVQLNALDIIFTPPKPITSFNGSIVDGLATIILQHANTGRQTTITVNRISGLVSID